MLQIRPDTTRLPTSIGQIRSLLTTDSDRARFAAELEATSFGDREEFSDWLEDWGAYAIGLHDHNHQQNLALIRAGHPEKIPTVPAESAHRHLGITE
jgi:hypothetical protein